MKLAVFSHKKCWTDPNSQTGFVTVGGFAQQMRALSELFDQTTLYLLCQKTAVPSQATPLQGHYLTVVPLPPLPEAGWRRKWALPIWLLGNLATVWRAIQQAEAVHTPVPSDIGGVGLLLSLCQKKRLFVRHCSLWGQKSTLAGWLLFWLLEWVADKEQTVVMATGGSNHPPSRNPHIEWIFSSSLTIEEWTVLPQAQPWQKGEPLNLIFVGRLEAVKNVDRLLPAVADVRQAYPFLRLHIVGQGTMMPALQQLSQQLQLPPFVTFHGNLMHTQVMHLLSQSHLFLLPSQFEGFPKALWEAMACGLPIIATHTSVVPFLVGQAGILLPQPTVPAISAAIHQMLSDPERMAQMGYLARQNSQQYNLDGWQQQIRQRLTSAGWQR